MALKVPHQFTHGRRLRMWELCCGSKTVAGAFKECGWQVWTTDIEPECEPDFVGDLMNYDFEDLVRISGFRPDFIWFSPPCTVYSMANLQSSHFEKRGSLLVPVTSEALASNRFVLHGLDIIRASECAYSVTENPRGLLRTQSMMKAYPRYTVTYCQYGLDHMKPTDLWGDVPYSWSPRACNMGDDCHEASPRGSNQGMSRIRDPRVRAIVPRELALSLCFCATRDFPMRYGLSRWQT